ncbi:uncharacterized protein N7469_010894 [Penicillium citrinum]|uniref:RNase III domain-containing protein n=1 Tax=Penicillium citrinum TaxID=5077 RepID=A0A9W9NL80_PENCI|nr:uncharacterized protein N7469_010894 [Penicillium citrinum]KAJ5222007.1 hypothetical protein N7469_010894 [Penicillium citrinum]
MALNLSIRAVRSARAVRSVPRPVSTLLPCRTYATIPTAESKEPRWSYTPPRTKAPFSLHNNAQGPKFHVNSDPALLDKFYTRLLGQDGDKMLSDEVKWLAVTHKSFDQGRRGFNDRLAFLGKQIVQLQASLALVQNSTATSSSSSRDAHDREPFSHPALNGLQNLSPRTKNALTDRKKLAELARTYETEKIIRWNPRLPENLHESGIELVLAQTLYSVIGAISLEKGGHIANKVAQERILEPLGFKTVL